MKIWSILPLLVVKFTTNKDNMDIIISNSVDFNTISDNIGNITTTSGKNTTCMDNITKNITIDGEKSHHQLWNQKRKLGPKQSALKFGILGPS